MTTNREDAVTLMLEHPARVAQACGYPLLKEELHGAWIRSMILGKDDVPLS